jgi:hypothetical protein
VNVQNIPTELIAYPNWVAWKWETRDGKKTKPLYDAKANGKAQYAKSNDPTTWAKFETAINAVEGDPFSEHDYSGVGFVLKNTPFIGVDFDGVVHDGKPEEYVLEILNVLGDPYTEITPSGNGLRAFVTGVNLPAGKRKFSSNTEGKYGAEIYSGSEGGRYLTVTGDKFSGKGIPTPENINLAYFMISQITNTKLKALWMGDMSAYKDDHSAADLALLGILARLLNGDVALMEEYFSASELGQRDKWERKDYRERSIKKALEPLAEAPKEIRREVLPSQAQSNRKDSPVPTAPTYTWDSATPICEIPDTPKEWILPDILVKGESTMLTGDFGSFKSYMTLFIADAVSEGGVFINRVAQKHPVLILDRENSKSTVSLRRFLVGNLRESNSVKIFGRFTNPAAPEITHPEIKELCRTVHPLVIIDSAQDFHPGKKENDADDMAVFGMEVNALIDAGAVGVIIIHHVPKTGKGKGKMYRGTTAIPGGFGGALFVEKVDRLGVKISGFKTRDDEETEIELQLQFPSKSDTGNKTGRLTYKIIKSGLDREGELKAQIVRHVRDNDGCSVNDVFKAVGGAKKEVCDFVDQLVKKGRLSQDEVKRGQKSSLHASGTDTGQSDGRSFVVNNATVDDETVAF